MMTLAQFYIETELKDDFPDVTEATALEMIHCLLCELTDVLNRYYEYTKVNKKITNV